MTNDANSASIALLSPRGFLLIKRAFPPFAGLWTLPGGRRDAGETALQCALREVEEETGIALDNAVHVGTSDIDEGYVLAVFAARVPDTDIAPAEEIADWRWVDRGELTGMAVTPDLAGVLAMAEEALNEE